MAGIVHSEVCDGIGAGDIGVDRAVTLGVPEADLGGVGGFDNYLGGRGDGGGGSDVVASGRTAPPLEMPDYDFVVLAAK